MFLSMWPFSSGFLRTQSKCKDIKLKLSHSGSRVDAILCPKQVFYLQQSLQVDSNNFKKPKCYFKEVT